MGSPWRRWYAPALVAVTVMLLIVAGWLWAGRWLGGRPAAAGVALPTMIAVETPPTLPTPTLAVSMISDATAAGHGIEVGLTATRTATPQPTETALLTATPAATSTQTPAPMKSATAASSPTVASSPTRRPTPCAVAIMPIFQTEWADHAVALGCAAAAGQRSVDMTAEDFQGGRMMWRSSNRQIYVVYENGRWQRFDDAWHTGLDAFSCGQAQSPPTPQRGFGMVWCAHEPVRQALGQAVNAEWAVPAAIQDFAGGLIIQLNRSGGPTYILYQDGSWRS